MTWFNIYHTLLSFLLAIFSRSILDLTRFIRICPVPGGWYAKYHPRSRYFFFAFLDVLGQNKHFWKIIKKLFCQSLIRAHTTFPDCHVSVSQLFKGVIRCPIPFNEIYFLAVGGNPPWTTACIIRRHTWCTLQCILHKPPPWNGELQWNTYKHSRLLGWRA